MFKYVAFLTAAALSAAPALALNNSFETGDTTGWATSANAGVSTSIGGFTPTNGSFLGFTSEGNGASVYATLSQTFTLAANQTVSGSFGFRGADGLPFNDDGYLSVNGVHLIDASVASVQGTGGTTGWLSFNFVAPTAGNYVLEIGARNFLDNCCGGTVSVIDGITISAVPEPGTWALMLTGFGLVGAAARRRSGAVVSA